MTLTKLTSLSLRKFGTQILLRKLRKVFTTWRFQLAFFCSKKVRESKRFITAPFRLLMSCWSAARMIWLAAYSEARRLKQNTLRRAILICRSKICTPLIRTWRTAKTKSLRLLNIPIVILQRTRNAITTLLSVRITRKSFKAASLKVRALIPFWHSVGQRLREKLGGGGRF